MRAYHPFRARPVDMESRFARFLRPIEPFVPAPREQQQAIVRADVEMMVRQAPDVFAETLTASDRTALALRSFPESSMPSVHRLSSREVAMRLEHRSAPVVPRSDAALDAAGSSDE